jgi:hypothetical protein
MLRIASFASLAVSVFLAFAPIPAAAAADPDAAVLRAYPLSLDKLARFKLATDAATKAVENDPAMAAEQEAMEAEPDKTLAEKRAMFVKHPKAFAFYRQQGLTIDDVVVGTLAAANAMIAAAAPNPQPFAEYVSPAQLAFAKANMAALQKIFSAQ